MTIAQHHPTLPKHLAIIGMGLLGSSFARAIKQSYPDIVITSCNRDKNTCDRAIALALANHATQDPAQAVQEADMVMIATPLSAYEAIIPAIAPRLKKGAIVTDMGSVKGYVINLLRQYLSEKHYALSVPGHPIAGSEKSGIEAGSVDMFRGKRMVLTPTLYTKRDAVDVTTLLWGGVGAHVQEMDADVHDGIYAYVSHAVQLVISAAMVSSPPDASLWERDPSYRLFWRIGGSDPVMWKDVCMTNHQAIARALKGFLLRIESLSRLLRNERYRTLKLLHHQSRMLCERSHCERFPPMHGDSPSSLFSQFIACAFLAYVSAHELHYAGKGFGDVTQIIMQSSLVEESMFAEQKSALLEQLDAFSMRLKALLSSIESRDAISIYTLLQEAQDRYQALFQLSTH